MSFNERWLQPGGIVPVDIPTTGELIREIQRLRALVSPEGGAKMSEIVEKINATAEGYAPGGRAIQPWMIEMVIARLESKGNFYDEYQCLDAITVLERWKADLISGPQGDAG